MSINATKWTFLAVLCAAVWRPFTPCPLLPLHLESTLLGVKDLSFIVLGVPPEASVSERQISRIVWSIRNSRFPNIHIFFVCRPPASVGTPEIRWADQHPEYIFFLPRFTAPQLGDCGMRKMERSRKVRSAADGTTKHCLCESWMTMESAGDGIDNHNNIFKRHPFLSRSRTNKLEQIHFSHNRVESWSTHDDILGQHWRGALAQLVKKVHDPHCALSPTRNSECKKTKVVHDWHVDGMTVCGFDRTKGLRWVRAASHARPADYEDYTCARHSSGQEGITAQARCIKTSKDMYILQCANAPKLAWLPSTFVQNGVCKTQTFAKKKKPFSESDHIAIVTFRSFSCAMMSLVGRCQWTYRQQIRSGYQRRRCWNKWMKSWVEERTQCCGRGCCILSMWTMTTRQKTRNERHHQSDVWNQDTLLVKDLHHIDEFIPRPVARRRGQSAPRCAAAPAPRRSLLKSEAPWHAPWKRSGPSPYFRASWTVSMFSQIWGSNRGFLPRPALLHILGDWHIDALCHVALWDALLGKFALCCCPGQLSTPSGLTCFSKTMNLKRQKQPPYNTVSNTPTKIWQKFHGVPVSPRTLMSMIQGTSTCFKRTFRLLQKFQGVSLCIFCLYMKRCMCTCTRLVNVSVLGNTGLLAPCTSTKNQVATIAGHTSAPEDPLRQMHGFFFFAKQQKSENLIENPSSVETDRWSSSVRVGWMSREGLSSLNAASFLQILDNFLRSIPGEDDSSSSIRHTNILFHVELHLSIEYLPTIVVLEIPAHAVTRIIRVLNFFVPKFWISMLYSVEYNFLWNEFSPRIAC